MNSLRLTPSTEKKGMTECSGKLQLTYKQAHSWKHHLLQEIKVQKMTACHQHAAEVQF